MTLPHCGQGAGKPAKKILRLHFNKLDEVNSAQVIKDIIIYHGKNLLSDERVENNNTIKVLVKLNITDYTIFNALLPYQSIELAILERPDVILIGNKCHIWMGMR